ncbi:hypothetical protein OKA04_17205 [Luteolibacter flavescens]|uniref:Uncharacterized protein n=1 Tax=Luteolibacter flavescens TaxID=1859460 RepID=A0ABT3FSC1_9BACT|nr:hypothetical protein [Luteolibacter flavescens]MCW1886479.1 hypothetical protein [Luteolibacter flavescens]
MVPARRGSITQSASLTRRRRGERRQRTVIHVSKEWVIAGLIGVLLLVAITGLWVMGRKHAVVGGGVQAEVHREGSDAAPEKWHGPIPSVIADRFTKATTHQQRLELVRNPAEVGPAMEAFFKTGPGSKEQITGVYPMTPGTSGDVIFESYGVEIADSPNRMLTVLVDPGGAKVDFECYARTNSVSWDDLLSGKVSEASEVRVILSVDGYYLHGFSDEKKWIHFRTTSPDLPESLNFYLDRQSPLVAEIKDAASQAFRATVSIRSVDGSEKHRQFEITALKALAWVEPD